MPVGAAARDARADSMKPRAHNLISYCLALVVFVVVLVARSGVALGSIGPAAVVGSAMWCLHFARRAAESAWVHRYAKTKVPTSDVIVEYIYYWGFAAWNAYALSAVDYHGPAAWSLALGGAVFVLAELGNARAHRMLRDLRPAGSALRVIPRGFLFELVSCPHYLFEILSWVGFALVVRTWASVAFLLLGSGILASWAHTRHVAYRKDFDGHQGRELYPSARRALIPLVF